MKAIKGMGMLAALFLVVGAQADSVTHGGTTINMDFVDIGYAENAGDTANTVNGLNPGSVGYDYRIGKFEVTAAQWDAVRLADPNVGNAGLYSGSQPAATSSWYEAAKFSNWLTTGNAYSGVYQFNGSGALTNVMSRAQIEVDGGLFYVLPTEDEWYKAAYLKSDGSAYTLYASGDSIPGIEADANYGGFDGTYSEPWDVGTGNAENNGTFDMNGNVLEWNESAWDGTLDDMEEFRVFRGGKVNSHESLLRSSWRPFIPSPETGGIGFRVAAIPEPSSILLMGVAGGFALFIRRRFRR